MSEARTLWCREGRPRGDGSPAYREYKRAKRKFRRLHRNVTCKYMVSLNQELDRTAELDSDRFWRQVKYRRKSNQSNLCAGINFDGQVVRDRREITDGWGKYFEKLYSPTQSDHFDNELFYRIEQDATTFDTVQQDTDVVVLPEDVSDAILGVPKGKTGGVDKLQYEHFIHARATISPVLANLFTQMLRTSYVPASLKHGVIVTLHKGGNKCKDVPDNYRAITLTYVVLKLFETVVMKRCKQEIISCINKQQGGFQDGLGCLMTSFVVRESIHYSRELGSPVYVCYLDGRKAFDTVWHSGLLYKLRYECNMDDTSFKAIKSMYTDMKSCVKFQGLSSSWFSVDQGTRQGGKSSPIFYLLYINGLIQQLQVSGLGMCIYNLNVSSPTVADDMMLMSYSVNGLNAMLDICNTYANKWRYQYNPGKCSVVVYNDSSGNSVNRTFKLGPNIIAEQKDYVHLGVICDLYLNTKKSIQEACRKLRGTFLSICNSGIHPEHLNPISSKKIYNSVVIPKSLYGCELWDVISSTCLQMLERSHRFCVKYMQSLKPNTPTDYVLSSIDMVSIESLIDYRKLQFLGQLCRLSNNYLAKDVFNNRLVRFMQFDTSFRGFLPDVYRLLQKYQLSDVLYAYKDSGSFPSKYSRKRTLTSRIFGTEKSDRHNRLISSFHGDLLRDVITVNEPSGLWQIAKLNPTLSNICKGLVSAIGVLCSHEYIRTCPKCSMLSDDMTTHLLLKCSSNNELRESMWDNVIDRLGLDWFAELIGCEHREQCVRCISLAIQNDNKRFSNFWMTKFVFKMSKV